MQKFTGWLFIHSFYSLTKLFRRIQLANQSQANSFIFLPALYRLAHLLIHFFFLSFDKK